MTRLRHSLLELECFLDSTLERCGRFEVLLEKGLILPTDCLVVYEVGLVGCVASFEEFLANGLRGCAVEDKLTTNTKGIRRIIFTDPEAFEPSLARRGEYIKYFPLKDFCGLASIYLAEARPFSAFDPNDSDILSQVTTVRNAIAHKSDAAARKFSSLSQAQALPKPNRTPGNLLRHNYNGSETLMKLYLDTLRKNGRLIQAAWC